MIPAYRERQCGSPSHLIAALYAPSGGVKVPPHGYMGSPPSGRSTLTPPASAGKVFRHEVGGGRMREDHKRADNLFKSCGGPDRSRI
jgi:hypothetical protein